MTQEQINKQFTAKVKAGIFNPVRRYLTNDHTAEDRWQDAVAQTWWMFSWYATDKGKVLDDGILVHSCRQRAVDLDRHFVPADDTWRNQDVLDPRAYRNGKVEVLRIDGIHEDGGAEGDRGLHVGFAEALASNPGRKIRSAIDLESWIGELSHRDRYIMEARMAGYSLGQIVALPLHRRGRPGPRWKGGSSSEIPAPDPRSIRDRPCYPVRRQHGAPGREGGA